MTLNTHYKSLYIKSLTLTILSLLCLFTKAQAQSTRVKGRVIDAESGEPLAFVGIFFKGTSIGVSSDLDGYYSIECRDENIDIISAAILGYDSQEYKIHKRAFNKIDFKLKPSHNILNSSLVKPDDSYMKKILKSIQIHKDKHNPEKRNDYQCKIYSKIELGLGNPRENLSNKYFNKHFGFVFDYIDTSVISGKEYLPVLISETVARKIHKISPELDQDIIEANKISGLNTGNSIARFTGTMLLKANFYNNYINAFKIDIPTPLNSMGYLYYNYYLIDSLNIEGRKTYKIRFHPKKLNSSPSFDGEMNIDAIDFAIKSINVKLDKEANVNWVKDLVISEENHKINDSTWFYKNQNMYVDMSVSYGDSSKLASVIGKRTIHYYNSTINKLGEKDIDTRGFSTLMDDKAEFRDSSYWNANRPFKLSKKEREIYHMVDSFKSAPIYQDVYSTILTLATGYYERGKISFGPYSSLYSRNNLEGARFQLGVRSTKAFSRKYRLMGYIAYGIIDKHFKGGGELEYMISRFPTKKLTLSAKRDVRQLGVNNKIFKESNIAITLLAKDKTEGYKKSRVDEFRIDFEQELNANISNIWSFESKRVYANRFVPMIRRDSTRLNSISENLLEYKMILSWHREAIRGVFEKKYVYTKYPIISLDLQASVTDILKEQPRTYAKAEFTLDYSPQIPLLGTSTIKFNAGKIFGQVDFPLLKLHEGNSTYVLNKSAFNCMDYYEFASDSWASIMYEHNFFGFFLGKIPLIRKLNLREIATFKAVIGSISNKNDGNPLNKNGSARLYFPQGMSALNSPYIEAGVGISNIFKLIRVDANWRLSHRFKNINGKQVRVKHLFSINVGFEFKF